MISSCACASRTFLQVTVTVAEMMSFTQSEVTYFKFVEVFLERNSVNKFVAISTLCRYWCKRSRSC